MTHSSVVSANEAEISSRINPQLTACVKAASPTTVAP
jgi:hypothetical protein